MNTISKGLLMVAKNCFTESKAANSSMAPDMMPRPTNSKPKPARMLPVCFHFSRFENIITKAPIPAKAEKSTVVEMPWPPNMPKATSCAVTVVPMLAP